MFLFSYTSIRSMLDLSGMILSMFLEIWKTRVKYQQVVIMTRAHLSQLKIVHLLRVYTFGMFITSIWHVASWGVAPPI